MDHVLRKASARINTVGGTLSSAPGIVSGTTAERIDAIFAVTKTGMPSLVIDSLLESLDDADPDIRDFTAIALAVNNVDVAYPTIADQLASRAPGRATGAAWAVAQFGRNPALRVDAIARLQRYRKRARGFSRAHADALLAQLGEA